jgi:hypothetical protein
VRSVTNYEKIISLSVGELAEFLEEVESDFHPISDSRYCDEVCEHMHTVNGKRRCTFAEGLELPCTNLKPIECITAWLNTEAVERDK